MDDRRQIAADAADDPGLDDLRVPGPRSAVAEIQEENAGGRPGGSAEPDGERYAEVRRVPSARPALSHPCRGSKAGRWTDPKTASPSPKESTKASPWRRTGCT